MPDLTKDIEPKNHWWIMAGLAGFALVSYMARANISIAAEPMMRTLGLNKIQMGQIFTAYLLGYAIFQVPGGWLGDRFGARWVLSFSALVWGLTTVFTGLAGGISSISLPLIFGTLWIIRFILGATEATTFPVGNLVVRDWMSRRDRAFGNSIMFLGTSLASAATGPLVSWVMLRFGWAASFYVTALPCFAIALLWAVLFQGAAARRSSITPMSKDQRDGGVDGRIQVIGLLKDRNAVLLILSYISEGYVLFLFVFWIYIYLVEQRGFSALSGGWATAVPWLTALVLTPFGGLACDRIAQRRGRLAGARVVIIIGYGLSGVLLFLAAYSSSRLVAVAALSLSISSLMAAESSFWASASHIAGEHAGLVSGVMNSAGILGGVLSTSIVPIIVHRAGWLPALATGTGMSAFCVVMWMGVRSRAH